MNAKSAEVYLAGFRAEKPLDPKVEKAAKYLENDATARETLRTQAEFDARMLAVLAAIDPPSDLGERIAKVREAVPLPKRSRHAVTAIAAIVLGAAMLLGFLVYYEMEQTRKFPGRENLIRLMSDLQGSSADLEPISTRAGGLTDWFYVRNFDGYRLPPELENAPVAGMRIFRLDGAPVAQVAVEVHDSLLYVFRAKDFGVQLPVDGEWRIMENSGWVGAVKRQDDSCALLAFRGHASDMRAELEKLRKGAPRTEAGTGALPK